MPKAKYRMKRHAVIQPQDQSYKIIPLTKGQNALVDTEDYERVNRWNWVAHWAGCTKSFYADREEDGKTFSMHRFVMNCVGDEQVDHIDGDTLNNRKYNLRKCTQAQNTKKKRKRESSLYIGIYKVGKKWAAEVAGDGKRIYLGRFISPESAARARDVAAKKLHGEFAVMNFP